MKQIQEEGHLIGNHTYNHVQLDKISKEAAKEEIETTNQKIFEITGVYPAWLRPPYGEWTKKSGFLCGDVSCTLGCGYFGLEE